MIVEPGDIKDLKYTADGRSPAMVQDRGKLEVRMLAYMNAEGLRITLAEGRTCFWSRSRRVLWRKGETSGHIQRIHSVATDCDRDTLLIQVDQEGVACHTGTRRCFD